MKHFGEKSYLTPHQHAAKHHLQPIKEVLTDDNDHGTAGGPALTGADGFDTWSGWTGKAKRRLLWGLRCRMYTKWQTSQRNHDLNLGFFGIKLFYCEAQTIKLKDKHFMDTYSWSFYPACSNKNKSINMVPGGVLFWIIEVLTHDTLSVWRIF